MRTTTDNKLSLTERIFQELRDDIVEGKYRIGDPLIETVLAHEFGVSRTPIREALKQLEFEGLVVSLPNRGVTVHGLSDQDIEDIFTIRLLLEGQAAYWAAERIDEEKLARMSEITELMELYTRKNDAIRLSQLDTEFHQVVFSACDSRMLEHVLTYLHQNAQRARRASLVVPNRPKMSLHEHREILAAIETHDPALAKAKMEEHVHNAKERRVNV